MSKKNPFTRTDRGPTFIGLAPKREKSFAEKKDKQYNKHKNKREEYSYV